jgi:hypothetical protein
MASGLIATLLLRSYVAYTWYVMIGAGFTFFVGYFSGFVFPRSTDANVNRQVEA